MGGGQAVCVVVARPPNFEQFYPGDQMERTTSSSGRMTLGFDLDAGTGRDSEVASVGGREVCSVWERGSDLEPLASGERRTVRGRQSSV